MLAVPELVGLFTWDYADDGGCEVPGLELFEGFIGELRGDYSMTE